MIWFWLDLFSSFPYSLVINSVTEEGNGDNTAKNIE